MFKKNQHIFKKMQVIFKIVQHIFKKNELLFKICQTKREFLSSISKN